jgi:hypothetical protein
MFTLIALLLVASVVAEVKSGRRGGSSSSASTAIHHVHIVEHTSDNRPLPFQYYDDRSSSDFSTSTSDSDPSGTGHLNDSPYYIARMSGLRIHQFIRKNLNMTHALCDRFEVSVAYNNACKAVIFNSIKELLAVGELNDHVALVAGASTAFRSVPSVLARRQLCGPVPPRTESTCDAQFWTVPEKETRVSTFLVNTAWEAKRACHHTDHTVDDRCKNKVECLVLETLAVSYPDIFALKGCSNDDLNLIPTNTRKNPPKKNKN